MTKIGQPDLINEKTNFSGANFSGANTDGLKSVTGAKLPKTKNFIPQEEMQPTLSSSVEEKNREEKFSEIIEEKRISSSEDNPKDIHSR